MNATRMRRWTAALVLCAAGAPALALVEANSGTVGKLRLLADLDRSGAERVVQQRRGKPFADWADLMKRLGVDAAQARRLSDQGLVVRGQVFIAETEGQSLATAPLASSTSASTPKGQEARTSAAPAIGAQAPERAPDKPVPATRSPEDKPPPASAPVPAAR